MRKLRDASCLLSYNGPTRLDHFNYVAFCDMILERNAAIKQFSNAPHLCLGVARRSDGYLFVVHENGRGERVISAGCRRGWSYAQARRHWLLRMKHDPKFSRKSTYQKKRERLNLESLLILQLFRMQGLI